MRFGARRVCELRVSHLEHGLRVSLKLPQAGASVWATVDVSGQPRLEASGTDDDAAAYWSIAPSDDDACEVRQLLLTALEKGLIAAGLSGRPLLTGLIRAREAIELGFLHVETLLDKARLAVARAFHPRRVFQVYSLLEQDDLGRFAQLIHACPGAFLFGLTLCQHPSKSHRVAGQSFLGDVEKGRPLAEALNAALSATRSDSPMGGPERAALRSVIRRAPASLSPDVDLSSSLPPAFVIDDVPEEEVAKVTWYTLVFGRDQSATGPRSAEATAFSAFIARNAVRLAERVAPGRAKEAVSWLWQYATLCRVRITRSSSLNRVVLECRAWMTRLEHAGMLPPLTHALFLANVDDASPLPQLCKAWKAGGAIVEPITTLGALMQEAEEMDNCLGTLAPLATAGQAFFFSAWVGDGRLAVQISIAGGKRSVAEVAARSNHPPTSDQLRGLVPWLTSIGAIDEAFRSRLECALDPPGNAVDPTYDARMDGP